MVAALGLVGAVGARAQEGVLTPAQSAAKAKQMIQQAIDALGGQTYLGVRDETCEGRVAFFGDDGRGDEGQRDERGREQMLHCQKPPRKHQTCCCRAPRGASRPCCARAHTVHAI